MSADQGSAADSQAADAKIWNVFLCYRQSDGGPTAEWLYKHLKNYPLLTGEEHPPKLLLYYDQVAAATGNWHEIHKPALEKARAMIVVCTPGAALDEGSGDQVQKEIRWWIRHRKTAPIIIDAFGAEKRYIPRRIKDRWPEAQRVMVLVGEFAEMRQKDRALREHRIVNRIAQGISLSESKVRDEELERRRRTQRMLVGALVLAGIALLLSLYFWNDASHSSKLAREREQLADRLRRVANLAWLGGLTLQGAETTHEASLGALLVIEALRREPSSLQAQLAWARVLEYYPPRPSNMLFPPSRAPTT